MSKIRELAEVAAEEVVNEVFDEMMLTETSDGATLEVPAVFIDRLGELIVQECIEQVWYTREDGINGNVSEVIKERMKQHFGINE